MKKLFLFLLCLPALSFAQNLEQVEGRLTVLESLVFEPDFVVVDSAGVEIGNYVADGTSDFHVLDQGIGLNSQSALIEVDVLGRKTLFLVRNAGNQALLWPWYPTIYSSPDCTGQAFISLEEQFLGLNAAYDAVAVQANTNPPQLLEPTPGAVPQSALSLFGTQQLGKAFFNICQSTQADSGLGSPKRIIEASVFMLDATPFIFISNLAGIPNFGLHQPPFVLKRTTKTQPIFFQ